MAIPYPETERDWMRMFVAHTLADSVARADPELRAWLGRCRLNPSAQVAAHNDPNDPAYVEATQRLRNHVKAALERLTELQRAEA